MQILIVDTVMGYKWLDMINIMIFCNVLYIESMNHNLAPVFYVNVIWRLTTGQIYNILLVHYHWMIIQSEVLRTAFLSG